MYSRLDNMLHCSCDSIKMLGYPGIYILRVISFIKQKIKLAENSSV